MDKFKYPRTHHLPTSRSVASDDISWGDHEDLPLFGKQVIITEKMDGENTSLYGDGSSHARSLDSRNHASRNWVKAFWGQRSHLLPEGWRVCGENVYAQHSIAYIDLESYFYGFALYDEENYCISWPETCEWFDLLGIVPVPVLWKGVFDMTVVKNLVKTLDFEKVEGFVVRTDVGYPFEDFTNHVAKWVRKSHVQTDEHWMSKPIIPNKLKETS